jgi:RNA polymerase sigma-70 factor (sigma-E family)
MESSRRRDFEDFVRANGQQLHRLAFVLTGDDSSAQDLVQSALAAVYFRWPKVDPSTAIAYVSKCIINGHRRSWRSRLPPAVNAPTPLRDSSQESFDIVDNRAVLRTALAKLSPRRRAVIVCRYYLDLSERETSETLSLPLNTVKSHSARGLAELKRVLTTYGTIEMGKH